MSKKNKKKQSSTYICEYCGTEHDGSYGSGRFCCASCSRRFSNTFVSEEGRKNQIATLTDPKNREKSIEGTIKSNHARKIARLQNEIPELFNEKVGKGTLAQGKIGELETTKRFLERDIMVYLPAVDNQGIDMIADFGGKLQKIQVKTSSRGGKKSAEFKLSRTRNNFTNGDVVHNTVGYNKDDVDYFALYDNQTSKLFLLENNESRKSIIFRYDNTPANNQFGTNHAEDYEFDKVLDEIEMGFHQSDIIEADYEVIDDEDESDFVFISDDDDE